MLVVTSAGLLYKIVLPYTQILLGRSTSYIRNEIAAWFDSSDAHLPNELSAADLDYSSQRIATRLVRQKMQQNQSREKLPEDISQKLRTGAYLTSQPC